ncbi:hypothetical protein MUP77_01435 [Candidatus Bathyarchaeota archaeon]|nr:hypothetical protein [Candidatus Bathyarchaeota archaeon]
MVIVYDEKELARLCEEGYIATLGKLRLRRLWNKHVHGLPMPIIHAHLWKFPYVKQLRDFYFNYYPPEWKLEHDQHQLKEYKLIEGKTIGDTCGFTTPLKDGSHLMVLGENAPNRTLDELIEHELGHVLEWEVKRLRKEKGVKINIGGKIFAEDEEYLINKDIELE